MDPIDLLEKRIAALELQVLPQGKDIDTSKTQLVTDLLTQTHTMIMTALSCREVIVNILQRMSLINEYLDPTFSENHMEVEAKRQYIMELYPELKKTAELIHTFENLQPCLSSDRLENVPTLMDKLEQLTISNIHIYEESKQVTDNVLKALQQYNDITVSMRMLFAQLETSVTEMEIALQPKVTPDE